MTREIVYASEPKRLFLAWQAPDHLGDRYRWAVGLIEPSEQGFSLRYLRDEQFRQFNDGKSLHHAQELSYHGYPGFPITRDHRNGVHAAIMRRLPPRSRSDFGDYSRQFQLSPTTAISDFALLGITEAKLPSDGFSLVDPLDPEIPKTDLLMDVAGYRYYQTFTATPLAKGDPVEIVAELDNLHDINAVKFCHAGRKIGNVNRLQAVTFRRWLSRCDVEGVIDRLNGNSQRPGVFVYVTVRRRNQLAAIVHGEGGDSTGVLP